MHEGPLSMAQERDAGGSGEALDLQLLAEQKEREWRQVQQLRVESLDAALKAREKELEEERAKFTTLKNDFKYNLRLLNDRHNELEKYDAVVAEIKSDLALKDGEISELKMRMDELQMSNKREVKAKDELQEHYQRRIRDKQTEMEQYRVEKDAEINREREELEQIKRNLERQLREVEEELDIQRQELSLGFEEAMRKREHEFRVESDEMRSHVLGHELKVKVLQKELEQMKVLHQRSAQESEQTVGQHRELEKQLKHAQWQIQDVTAMKDAKIHELEAKLIEEKKATQRIQEDFKRKHNEQDGLVREKEAALDRVRNASDERERALQAKVRELSQQVEELQTALRQAQWTLEDARTENQATVTRLQEELADVRSRWDAHLSDATRGDVSKDAEIHKLRENETQLKTELIQRKHDIGRYQKDLVAAAERQSDLERQVAQVSLDWQRRHEGLERSQYERSEDLVKSLTQARDQALAESKSLKGELKQREDLIHVLTTDRDRAVATLKQHGLRIDHNVKTTGVLEKDTEAGTLQDQNDNLRAVIASMREEMETLGAQFPSNQHRGGQSARGKHDSVTAEYVKNLEKELQNLKAKNRKLEETLSDRKQEPPSGSDVIEKIAGNNAMVKAHVTQLNEVIGTLRSEKVEMATQLRKMQTRLHHLETQNEQMTQQVVERRGEVEQTRYELHASERRHTADVGALEQRVSDLNLQLTETRKEADEYYKANIQRNLEVTSLGNQLSALKLELAEKRPQLNFGAQELLIQQLEDEIAQLRAQERGDFHADALMSTKRTGTDGVRELQTRLKQAAQRISQLAREKQQLIEVGNRQRAQLMQAGIRHASPPARAPFSMETSAIRPTHVQQQPSSLQDKIHGKLQQLEALQYQLTKQKLAQQGSVREAWKDTPETSAETTPPSEHEQNEAAHAPSARYPRPSQGTGQREPVRKGTPPVRDSTVTWYEEETMRPSTAGSERGPGYLSAREQVMSGRMSREQLANVMMSLSSAGGESLQELWKMLDEENFSPLSTMQGVQHTNENSRKDAGQPGGVTSPPSSNNSWTIKGSQAPVARQQDLKSVRTYQPPQKSTGKPAKTLHKPKVRNYNVKDQPVR